MRALSLGIYRTLGAGDWVQVQPRVFRFRHAAHSWHQAVRAATLSLGPAAVASHATAAWLWKLEGVTVGPPRKIEVSMPRTSAASLAGVRIHHPRGAATGAWSCDQIPVTSLPRTLIDLAAFLDESRLKRALRAAVFRAPSVLDALEPQLSTKHFGRSGVGVLTRIARRQRSVPTDSDLEEDTLAAIRGFGLPEPVLQYRVRDEAGIPVAKADFAWPALRVLLLADGVEIHRSAKVFENDLLQTSVLEALGWRVTRVHRKMLLNDVWLVRLGHLLEAQRRLGAALDAAR